MEAPRRTVSIGPVTISVRRGERDDVAHIGPVASPLVHLIVLILAILFTSSRAQKQRAEDAARADVSEGRHISAPEHEKASDAARA